MTKPSTENWQTDFRNWITRTTSAADDVVDAGSRRLRKRLGRSGLPKIQPYMGYASVDTIRVHGRVLTNPPLDPDYANDQWWENLSSTIGRFASDEVPGVRVRATLGNNSGESISDAEGYFYIDLHRDEADAKSVFWSSVQLTIIDSGGRILPGSETPVEVMFVPPDAIYGIISDVDDTILHTGATNIQLMAKLTFFGNARTRAALDGVAQLYELMQHNGQPDRLPTNPIFYVSSSPWNLYDVLEDFLELNAIPKGPLLLRDLGFDENKFLKDGHDHKLVKIRSLVNLFDHLPFVLFGDSGQEDARLYAMAAEEFGSRISAIFIRDIDPDVQSEHDEKVDQYVRRSEAAGVPMFLVKDSNEVARITYEAEMLPADALNVIEAATLRDRKR